MGSESAGRIAQVLAQGGDAAVGVFKRLAQGAALDVHLDRAHRLEEEAGEDEGRARHDYTTVALTERMGGRYEAIVFHERPASRLAKTCPDPDPT